MNVGCFTNAIQEPIFVCFSYFGFQARSKAGAETDLSQMAGESICFQKYHFSHIPLPYYLHVDEDLLIVR